MTKDTALESPEIDHEIHTTHETRKRIIMELQRIITESWASFALSCFVCFAYFVVCLLCPSHGNEHGQLRGNGWGNSSIATCVLCENKPSFGWAKQPENLATPRFGPHRAGPRGPQLSNGGGLMSDLGNNESSAAATLETVSEKPLPEFARFVPKPRPPSDCDMHNPRKTKMPHFPRVSRGFSTSTTHPLENTILPIDVQNGPKTRKKIDFGQVRAKFAIGGGWMRGRKREAGSEEFSGGTKWGQDRGNLGQNRENVGQ